MTNPVPGYSVSTPYGKEGSAWGCGWHDGADFAAPAGTDAVAAWGGVVVEAAYPTSFGSAFGRAVVIDHDKLPDGSPGLWGLYAHLSAECVSVGQRVEAGQKIGDVGTTGNSSGNHLHFGVYAQPSWCSGCGKNPQPWIDAESGDDMADVLIYDYLEKPGGEQKITRSWCDLDQSAWEPKKKGKEDTFSYFRLRPTFKSGKTAGALQVRVMRENGDAHAPHTIPVSVDYLEDDGTMPTTFYTFELGEAGASTHVELRCVGGLESAVLTSSRYTTKAVVVG